MPALIEYEYRSAEYEYEEVATRTAAFKSQILLQLLLVLSAAVLVLGCRLGKE